jgi:hypothetical protein
MTPEALGDPTPAALAAATTVLPDVDGEHSRELAERLAIAGASELAVDAAGGPGTAQSLRETSELSNGAG